MEDILMHIKAQKLNNIVFINPQRPGSIDQFAIHKMPSEGPLLQATVVKKMLPDANITVIDERITPLTSKKHRYLCKEIYQADLLVISTMTCNQLRGYWIAEEARKNNSNVICWAGGFGPSLQPQVALSKGIKIVGFGEGVETIQELVLATENGGKAEDIQGIAYQEDGELIKTAPRKFITDLDVIPFADWKLLAEWWRVITRAFTTSAGCPYGCDFCCVTDVYGGKFRHRSIENSVEYVKWAMKDHKAFWPNEKASLFFAEDNIAGDEKHAVALFEALNKIRGLDKFSLNGQMRVESCQNNSLMEQMEGKFGWIFFGCEAITESGLESINKRQTVEQIIQAIEICHRRKIKFGGMFIFGLDNYTKESGLQVAEFALKHGIDAAVFFIRSPLPETADTKRLQDAGRLLNVPSDYLDCEFTTFVPLNMTPKELQVSHLNALNMFYNPWRAIWDLGFGHIDTQNFALRLAGAYYIWKGTPVIKKYIKEYLS